MPIMSRSVLDKQPRAMAISSLSMADSFVSAQVSNCRLNFSDIFVRNSAVAFIIDSGA